jgi:hypothetical protein
VYESQREATDLRAIRHADRIRKRLDWKPGILNGHGKIPKGMHGPTFRRLMTLYDKHVQVALAGHFKWKKRL